MIPSTVNKPLLYSSSFHILLGLLFISLPIKAQFTIEWNRTFGGIGYEEMGTALATSDGGYLFGGITTTRVPSFEITSSTIDSVDFPDPEPTGDYWMVKTDKDGNVLWDRRYGGKLQDRLWSIIETSDGGYLIGGDSRSSTGGDRTWPCRGDYDFWILKLDENGNKQWDRAYGGTGTDLLRRVIELPDGGYWLAGISNSPASFEKSSSSFNGSGDFWSVKIDNNGTPTADYQFGGGDLEEIYDAMLTADGHILLTGSTRSQPGFNKTASFYGANDIWIVKTAVNGNILWDASFGGNGEDVPQQLVPTADGSYIAVGKSTSDKMSGNKTADHYGGDDYWLVKFADNETGVSMTWNHSFGGNASDIGYSVAESSLGNLMVVGISTSMPDGVVKTAPSIGSKDYWALFLNPNGTKFWDETLGGTAEDVGNFIFRAHDYGYLLAGISNSDTHPPYKSEDARGNSTNDLFVIRTGCAFPPPELEDLPKACRDEQINVDATIPVPCAGCNYLWDDGSTAPIRSFTPDTTFQAKVTVIHPDGCEMADSLTIEIVPPPDSYQADGEPISCYGINDASFFIDSVSGIAPPFRFSLNGGEWTLFANYLNMAPGIYQLEILDTNGCTLDTIFEIKQPDSVLVELGPDIYLPFGDSVQLQALTNLVDSFTFVWGQPMQISCTDCLEPWVRPFFSTTISIELKDKNGCEATDNLRIIVQKSDAVFIPNAFSPTNLDNINDFFTVYADRTVQRVLSLLIFDRWGEKMFELYDFPPNMEQLGWNGRLNDRPLDPAVFTYWTEVEFIDGRIEIFKGDVTLMH